MSQPLGSAIHANAASNQRATTEETWPVSQSLALVLLKLENEDPVEAQV